MSPSGSVFVVARNPEEESSLPYLVTIPIEGGIVLKARAAWPVTSRVYCHPFEGPLPSDAAIVESTPVVKCQRRGPAIDLVLDRPRHYRSQFVFTEVKGRKAIFWQTQKTAKAANPGGRVPRRSTHGPEGMVIEIDTRETYPYRFAGRGLETKRAALPAGDYGVRIGEEVLASVERKSLENFLGGLSDGTLTFQLQRLAELPLSAVVVEGRYSSIFKEPRTPAGWLPEVLARLQVRYREVPIVFADSRKFAEEWTVRFLATAYADLAPAGTD